MRRIAARNVVTTAMSLASVADLLYLTDSVTLISRWFYYGRVGMRRNQEAWRGLDMASRNASAAWRRGVK